MQLQARAELQRARLASYHAQIERPIEFMEMTWSCVSSLRRSPLVLTGMAALLMKTPWRRVARFPKLAWRGWRIYRFVRNWAQRRPAA